MHNLAKDIKARFTLVPTEEGGRHTPARSGYRPQFYYDERDWDANIALIGKEIIYPGDTVEAYFTFVSPQCHVEKLHPGKEFLLREGQRTIARGEVLEVLDLEQSAAQRLAEDPNCMEGCT